MDEQIVKALLKKAIGYTYDEVQEEYTITDDGESVLTKKKIVKKHCPPDSTALKAYLELNPDKSYEAMTDEELEQEKIRLLQELKRQEDKQDKKQKQKTKSKDGESRL
ncbi:MAG: hypothetical protein J5815_03595 [Clostridia bacterium]|nr:hypothetical protein [Clostridia bacterium]